MNDVQDRALIDLKRELEAPRLSALGSTLGLAVVSAALRSFGDRATAAGSRRRPAPRGTDVQPVTSAAVGKGRPSIDMVDEWGVQSFPASDPPPNW